MGGNGDADAVGRSEAYTAVVDAPNCGRTVKTAIGYETIEARIVTASRIAAMHVNKQHAAKRLMTRLSKLSYADEAAARLVRISARRLSPAKGRSVEERAKYRRAKFAWWLPSRMKSKPAGAAHLSPGDYDWPGGYRVLAAFGRIASSSWHAR